MILNRTTTAPNLNADVAVALDLSTATVGGQSCQRELLSDPTTTEAVYFRRRFRVPFPFFEELLREVKAGEWEGFTTTETDVGGRPCIPVELKVRAASRPILADERSGCSVAAVAPGMIHRAQLDALCAR